MTDTQVTTTVTTDDSSKTPKKPRKQKSFSDVTDNSPNDSLKYRLLCFLSTKFLLALIFTVVGCAGFLMKILDPTNFNWLVGVVLTGHGASNILDKKLNS